jgi:hypothetical protein
MLKSITFILFSIFVVSVSLSGKEASDSTKSRIKTSVGIHAGLYLSNLKEPRTVPNGPPMGYMYYEVEDYGPTAGFSTGIFLDFKGAHKFSIQPEINFMWFSHDTKLVVVRSYNQSVVNYNYEYSYFNMQLSLLPKLTVGKKSNVKIMAGPYLRIPLIIRDQGEKTETSDEALQTCSGAVACLRFDTHINSGYLGFEIRAGKDIVSSEAFREASVTLGFLYGF